jgi:hypothetical protein
MANYIVSTNTNNSNNTTQNKTQKTTKEKTKQRKMDQLRHFKLKHDLVKIFVDLQTAFTAGTHRVEGQWLKEQLNVVMLRILCSE